MKKTIKNIIKNITPPILLRFVRGNKQSKYGYFGNYKSWQDAINDSTGYDDPAILEKVRDALLKVKNGEAVYERDSVLFDKIQYSWPLLSALLWIALENDGLNIIDFGGSLGSSYYQNIGFLKNVRNLKWNVVEQKSFVNCGKKLFENKELKFFYNVKDVFRESKPTTLLALSVLPYLKNPYGFIDEMMALDFKYIIFDRTSFLSNEDRLTIQKAPPEICEAIYPAWFFNEKKFLDILKSKYEMIAEFDSASWIDKKDLGDAQATEKGFIFKKK